MSSDAGGPPVVVNRLNDYAPKAGWESGIITTSELANDLDGHPYSLDSTLVIDQKKLPIAATLSKSVRDQVESADILHLHTMWSPMVNAIGKLARKVGTPYIVSTHGMLDPYSLGQKAIKKRVYFRLFESSILKHAAHVLFTTDLESQLAQESVGTLSNIRIIALGGDRPPKDIDALRQEFLSKNEMLRSKNIVVFLGRVHEKKRPDLAIEALQKVLDAVPDAFLLMVGNGEAKYVDWLKKKTDDLGLSEQVRFTGALQGEAKWRALAAANMFVLPSQQENFAIAVAEAMSAGLPVIITKQVNIWPDIEIARAGIAIESANSLELAGAYRDLLKDETKRLEFGRNALRLAREKYDWDVSSAKTYALYGDVLNAMQRNV